TGMGVIVIAATNRPDVLDPALLRPGRFDRQVVVPLPDIRGREQILNVHMRKVPIGQDIRADVIARGTPGFSGADLANLVNEPALFAARRNARVVEMVDFEKAKDKVMMGAERKSMVMSDEERLNTAYHESGHALVAKLVPKSDPVHKVTIIPRGPSLGSTMWLPEEDKYNTRKNELLDSIVVAMGGRVAEEIVFGDVTSGASGDIKMATNIARRMVCEWGMSDNLGMIDYSDGSEQVFLGRDLGRGRDYSEATAQKIDAEIKRLIDNGYQRAMDILLKHRGAVDALAKALLEFETLDGAQVRDIMEHGRMMNPPRSKPPTPPPVPSETPARENGEEELPPGLAGAPA
ncbi:MAG: ATP-dependent metallopeptidase FtsH/Yme1/Tma family protein, partial [Verrucomicrobiota bacterium]